MNEDNVNSNSSQNSNNDSRSQVNTDSGNSNQPVRRIIQVSPRMIKEGHVKVPKSQPHTESKKTSDS